MFLTIGAKVNCAFQLHVVARGAKSHLKACLTEADAFQVRELFYLRENLSSTEGVLSFSLIQWLFKTWNRSEKGEGRGGEGGGGIKDQHKPRLSVAKLNTRRKNHYSLSLKSLKRFGFPLFREDKDEELWKPHSVCKAVSKRMVIHCLSLLLRELHKIVHLTCSRSDQNCVWRME